MKRFRGYFLTGLIVILPSVVTLYVLWFIFRWIDGILGSVLPIFLRRSIPGLGFIITIILIMLAGLLTTNLLGRKFIDFGEYLLVKIPFARNIYFTTKQIVDTLMLKNKTAFKGVVLAEYPRKGLFTVGFVTGDVGGEIQAKTDSHLVNVFFPTTPNPTSGWLALVPIEQVTVLDMTVEEGIKFIISGGILYPSYQQPISDLEQVNNGNSQEFGEKGE